MLVVTFQTTGARNCVRVGERDYVYVTTPRGAFVMPAQCPHRGGPLHLGAPAATGDSLVCPWHQNSIALPRLRRRVPAVRRGTTVTAVLPHPPGARVELRHLPLSPALAA